MFARTFCDLRYFNCNSCKRLIRSCVDLWKLLHCFVIVPVRRHSPFASTGKRRDLVEWRDQAGGGAQNGGCSGSHLLRLLPQGRQTPAGLSFHDQVQTKHESNPRSLYGDDDARRCCSLLCAVFPGTNLLKLTALLARNKPCLNGCYVIYSIRRCLVIMTSYCWSSPVKIQSAKACWVKRILQCRWPGEPQRYEPWKFKVTEQWRITGFSFIVLALRTHWSLTTRYSLTGG